MAACIVLRLPHEVRGLFDAWLREHHPLKRERELRAIREMRGGRDNDPRFGSRMRGQGVWAELLRQRFDTACARLGLNRERFELDLAAFEPPPAAQGRLFCDA